MSVFGQADDPDGNWRIELAENFANESKQQAVSSLVEQYSYLWEHFQRLNQTVDPYIKEVMFNDVILKYTELHRHYHNLAHLEDLLSQYDYFDFGDDSTAVLGAIFYHDIVYQCQPGQDEQASAYWMSDRYSQLSMPDSIKDRTRDLILATAKHDVSDDDYNAQLFLDMDMSILAARHDRYKHYVESVTKEFCARLGLTPLQFQKARLELFLQPTLTSGRTIFKTPEYSVYEKNAVINMRHEADMIRANLDHSPQIEHNPK